MSELSKAVEEAVRDDVFVDFADYEDFKDYKQLWRVGAVRIRTKAKFCEITQKNIDKFESYGFVYLGDRRGKCIFRKKISQEEGKSGFKNLRHFYDTLF
jgi:hypothetical protein